MKSKFPLLITSHFTISETPLSLAVGIKKNPSKMLITIVNGGGIVDFRSKTDGSTAMHRAVTKNR